MFRAATFLTPVSLRRLGLVALACSALTLVGCGGGSRAKDYHPDSIVVFGDENSAFWSTEFVPNVAAGGNYSIHGLVYTVNPLGVGATYYCHDTTSTTRCDLTNASDLITDPVTQFLATDLTKPEGS